MNYYNEFDPYAAQWLRNLIAAKLIPEGTVDDRSIEIVAPEDLKGFTQCHFFAGIAGWSYALQLAGWPEDREIWTGSCPCQPFSVTGKGLGTADPRHLWPQFHRLITANRPPTVMGEQVSGKAGIEWFQGVENDLETSGYKARAVSIPACSVGADHIRPRIYWVAHAMHEGLQGYGVKEHSKPVQSETVIPECDNKSIREGICDSPTPLSVGYLDELFRPVGEVRAFGNAIVPRLAAEVIKAYMDVRP